MKIKINKKQIFEVDADKAEEGVEASEKFVLDMLADFDTIKNVTAFKFFEIVDRLIDEEKKKAEKIFILKTGFSLYSGNHANFNPQNASIASNDTKGEMAYTAKDFENFKNEITEENKKNNIVKALVPLEQNNNKIWGIRDIFLRDGYYYIDPKNSDIIYYTFVNKGNEKQAIVPVKLNSPLASIIKQGQTQLKAPDGTIFTTSVIDTQKLNVDLLLQIATSFYMRLPNAVEQYENKLGVDTPPAPAAPVPAPPPEPAPKSAPPPQPAPKPAPAATKFNIRSPSKDDFIKMYQGELLKFADKRPSTRAVLDSLKNYDQISKVEDSMYGHRTHFVTIKAVQSFKQAVEKAIKNLPAPEVQPPPPPIVPSEPTNESKIKRIESLAKLLNKKLNKIEKNFLFEAEDPSQREKLKKLLEILNNLEQKFTSVYDQGLFDSPSNDTYVDKAPIQQFLNFLKMAEIKDGKITNINDIADSFTKKQEPEKKEPEEKGPEKKGGTVTPQPKGDPKKDAALLYDASCWYNVDITIKGNPMTGPEGIWGAINDNKTFEMWYKNISKALEYEGYPDDYSFFVGPRVGYKSLVNLLYSRKDQSINLRCFINLFGRFTDHLLAQLTSAQDYYSRIKVQNSLEADAFLKKMKPYYLNDSGKFEGSVLHQAYLELNDATTIKVQAMIKRLINAANNAENAGNQKAAAVLGGVASGAPAAQVAAAASGTPTAPSKGVAGTQANPFPSQIDWLRWENETRQDLRKNNEIYFIDKTGKTQFVKYDSNGNRNPNLGTLGYLGNENNPFPSEQVWQKWNSETEPDDRALRKSVYYIYRGVNNKPFVQRVVYDNEGNRVFPAPEDASKEPSSAVKYPQLQQESLKEKRDWLLHEALFQKLVR